MWGQLLNILRNLNRQASLQQTLPDFEGDKRKSCLQPRCLSTHCEKPSSREQVSHAAGTSAHYDTATHPFGKCKRSSVTVPVNSLLVCASCDKHHPHVVDFTPQRDKEQNM
jgi:hypothetical protein